jgi:hypothetical protein
MPSNCPLTRPLATLSPEGGEGVKSSVAFPSTQRGEGPTLRKTGIDANLLLGGKVWENWEGEPPGQPSPRQVLAP